MNEIQEIKEYIKKNGDPFEVLEIPQTENKKEIKNAYKSMAKKHHPDKNRDIGSCKNYNAYETKKETRFIQIKHAYDFLSDKKKMDLYIKYFQNLKYREQELNQTSFERQQFAKDLHKREEQAEKKREEEQTIRLMKRNEEVFKVPLIILIKLERIRKEQELQQKEKQAKENRKIQWELDHKESYRKLNSIKVKWGKESIFNKDLLQLIFKVNGPIKDIQIKDNRKAIVEFHTTEAANNASQQGSEDLKVKFFMKLDKREKLQVFLKQSKEKLQRGETEVFQLSTDTLSRISHFYNKDSKIIVNSQMEIINREKERRRLMQQMLDEELMQ